MQGSVHACIRLYLYSIIPIMIGGDIELYDSVMYTGRLQLAPDETHDERCRLSMLAFPDITHFPAVSWHNIN